MKFVRINESNFHLLERVAADVFDNDIDANYLAHYLKRSGNALIVAKEAGQVVAQIRGIIHLQPDCAPQMFVENLGVTPAMTRRGIATKLMKSLIEWGKSEGCDEFWLATEIDNEEAIGFYDSLKLLKTQVVMFANFVDD